MPLEQALAAELQQALRLLLIFRLLQTQAAAGGEKDGAHRVPVMLQNRAMRRAGFDQRHASLEEMQVQQSGYTQQQLARAFRKRQRERRFRRQTGERSQQ